MSVKPTSAEFKGYSLSSNMRSCVVYYFDAGTLYMTGKLTIRFDKKGVKTEEAYESLRKTVKETCGIALPRFRQHLALK